MNITSLQLADKLINDETLRDTEIYQLYRYANLSEEPSYKIDLLDKISNKLFDFEFLMEAKTQLNTTKNAIHEFLNDVCLILSESIQDSLRAGGFITEEENKYYFWTFADDEDVAQLQLSKLNSRFRISNKQLIDKEWFKAYKYSVE